jgi:hypothetical protein
MIFDYAFLPNKGGKDITRQLEVPLQFSRPILNKNDPNAHNREKHIFNEDV